jgi:YVTN family beta-propeller protein
VSVIDTATGTVSAIIPVGNASGGVAITPDGKHAYVANAVDGTVSVIKTATGKVSAIIPVGGAPGAVATCPARSAHKRRR